MTEETRNMLEPFVSALSIAYNEDLAWRVLRLAYLAGKADMLMALPLPEPLLPEPAKATEGPPVTDFTLGVE